MTGSPAKSVPTYTSDQIAESQSPNARGNFDFRGLVIEDGERQLIDLLAARQGDIPYQ